MRTNCDKNLKYVSAVLLSTNIVSHQYFHEHYIKINIHTRLGTLLSEIEFSLDRFEKKVD